MQTSTIGYGLAVALFVLTVAGTSNVHAQVPYGPNGPVGARSDRTAYDAGYRLGLQSGERDGRAGRDLDYGRESAYRDGSLGYSIRFGSRDAYRAAFRAGFADGYRAAYVQYGRQGGWWGSSPRPGGPWTAPLRELAFDRGYRDGFDQGRRLGLRRARYDPRSERAYRNGDGGYDLRFGSRGVYRQYYREGFLLGYERGYRASRVGGIRGWP
jgi:hypothetical protein